MRTLLVLLVGVLVLASCENTTLAPLPTEEVVQVPAEVKAGPAMSKNVCHRFSCPAYDGSGGTCVCDGNGINAMDISDWAWGMGMWGFGSNGNVGIPGDGDGVSGRK